MMLLLLLLFTCRDVHGNDDAANGDATCVDADCVVVAYVDVDGCIVVVADAIAVAYVLNLLC